MHSRPNTEIHESARQAVLDQKLVANVKERADRNACTLLITNVARHKIALAGILSGDGGDNVVSGSRAGRLEGFLPKPLRDNFKCLQHSLHSAEDCRSLPASFLPRLGSHCDMYLQHKKPGSPAADTSLVKSAVVEKRIEECNATSSICEN